MYQYLILFAFVVASVFLLYRKHSINNRKIEEEFINNLSPKTNTVTEVKLTLLATFMVFAKNERDFSLQMFRSEVNKNKNVPVVLARHDSIIKGTFSEFEKLGIIEEVRHNFYRVTSDGMRESMFATYLLTRITKINFYADITSCLTTPR